MIPEVHLTEYQQTRIRAEALAGTGQLAAAYTELLGEWEVAVALQERGVHWAFPLGILYLVAMDEYCTAHWAKDSEPVAARDPVAARPADDVPPKLVKTLAKSDPFGQLRRAWLRDRRAGTGQRTAPGADA